MNINLLKKDIYNFRYAIILVIVYFIIMQVCFGKICPFKIVTKLDCPGCGLTRASLCLLQGEVTQAIEYNPTVFLWWTLIICGLVNRYICSSKLKILPAGTIIVGLTTITCFILSKI